MWQEFSSNLGAVRWKTPGRGKSLRSTGSSDSLQLLPAPRPNPVREKSGAGSALGSLLPAVLEFQERPCGHNEKVQVHLAWADFPQAVGWGAETPGALQCLELLSWVFG